MKLTKSELKKIIKEELEKTIREVAPFDAPVSRNTRVTQTAEKNKIRLLSALMIYLDVEQDEAAELLTRIEILKADN